MRGKTGILGIVSLLLVLALLLPCLVAAPVVAAEEYPYSTDDAVVADALDYLRGQQTAEGSIGNLADSAWVVMAIAAAGEDPHSWQVDGNPSIVDYLAANAGSAATANDYSRMILAVVASGEDPGNFGGVDFVSLLLAEYDGAQVGDPAFLNDDFWGLMALTAAGDDPTVMANIKGFILDNQGADGGWSWGVGQDSDVDDTAAAIMALIAAGQTADSTPIVDAVAYIKGTQMDNGGFESWGATNSGTNAWGICGLAAAGEDPTAAAWQSGSGLNPVEDMLTFRNGDGSFNWTNEMPSGLVLNTAYAVPALLGVPYPVPAVAAAEATVNVRIEGQDDTIWSGTVTVGSTTVTDDTGADHFLAGPTVLGALHKASLAGGFDYVIQDTAYGLYVYAIAGEEPAGTAGWMLRVDNASAMVGAADFVLNETAPPDPPHQEVLFAYSEWGETPLAVEVDNTSPEAGETFTVTVTAYDDITGEWTAVEGATVHAGQDYTTGADGTVAVIIDEAGVVEIYAEMDGHVRSDRWEITVEEAVTPTTEVTTTPAVTTTHPAATTTPTTAATTPPAEDADDDDRSSTVTWIVLGVVLAVVVVGVIIYSWRRKGNA